jgi:hypothetical protein
VSRHSPIRSSSLCALRQDRQFLKAPWQAQSIF